jgi:hypothetical protein
VTIVVPVLMMSCQVSEKPKIGPLTAHTTRTVTAAAKAQGRPAALEQAFANLSKA